MTGESDEILIRVDDGVGLLTLNRRKAINSLSHAMVTAVEAVLTGWGGDEAVRAVILNGAGDRGLCAGGDVLAIYHSAKADGVRGSFGTTNTYSTPISAATPSPMSR